MGKRARVAAVAVAAVTACGVTAYAATAGDGSAGGRVIRLHERGLAVNYIPVSTGAPIGDHYVFSADLLDDSGAVVGRDGADCTVTNVDGTVVCTIGLRLPGGGLTVSGLANGPENDFAITGGTGAFRGARGQVHAKDTTATTSDVTITLIG